MMRSYELVNMVFPTLQLVNCIQLTSQLVNTVITGDFLSDAIFTTCEKMAENGQKLRGMVP